MNYYYLVASLPSLGMDEAPPLSIAEFRELCAEHLTPRDLRVLDTVLDENEPADGTGFLREWRQRETRLRNAVVHFRAARLQTEAGPHLRSQKGVSLFTEQRVHDALSRPSPLERERGLDELRWMNAEDLAGRNPFSIRTVLSYAVRLQLAHRWTGMDPQKGAARRDALVSRAPGAEPVADENVDSRA